MMHFKNEPGFSLIEAMLAVAIVGLVLTPMFVLENSVFDGVSRMAQKFHRLLFAQQFFYTAQQKEPLESTKYTVERKEDKPLSMARYTLAPVSKKSSLASVARLYRQEVSVSGLSAGSPSATVVHYLFKPDSGSSS